MLELLLERNPLFSHFKGFLTVTTKYTIYRKSVFMYWPEIYKQFIALKKKQCSKTALIVFLVLVVFTHNHEFAWSQTQDFGNYVLNKNNSGGHVTLLYSAIHAIITWHYCFNKKGYVNKWCSCLQAQTSQQQKINQT